MNILVIGDKQRTTEFATKLIDVSNLQLKVVETAKTIDEATFSQFEALFDLNFSGEKSVIAQYEILKNRIVVLNAVTHSLTECFGRLNNSSACFAGMNTLPSFINKPIAELSLLNNEQAPLVNKLFEKLNWKTTFVADRVGLVTPRVICMLINEAFFTLQEQTATVADIDIAMKLGTNYPFGPFEWLEQIGVKNVYETLEAMYNDTHDERYKICPLLKTTYLQSK